MTTTNVRSIDNVNTLLNSLSLRNVAKCKSFSGSTCYSFSNKKLLNHPLVT